MNNTHPLDPLTPGEISQVAALIHNNPQFGPNVCLNAMRLQEPAKEIVLNFSPGDAIERRAFLILFDKTTNEVHEVVANLTTESLESIVQRTDVTPSIMAEEFEPAETAVKADPRFQEAMARRDIDIDQVLVDPWCCGFYGDPLEGELRLVRGIPYQSLQSGDNIYARPIENVVALVDLNTMEVVRIDDHGVVPMPTESGDYLQKLVDTPHRTDLKPLDIVQPEGVSFTVDGWQVNWQNWQFRVGFNHREGLTLHEVGYEDGGEVRPILYRASVAEMLVPYGDTSISQYRKNAFDSGEYGLGIMANSLELGCDCLGEIHYFDADLSLMNGEVMTIKNAICLHEEDYGLLWKHVDLRTEDTEVRRSRRLVLSFIATVGNYEYGFYWNFYQDGNIELDIKLTGLLQTGAYAEGTEVTHGAPLNDRLYAPNHQHFFCVRMDSMIDGLNNTVVEVDTVADPMGPTNPYGNAFYAKATPLTTEQEAQRQIDPLAARYWTMTNPNSLNKVGKPVSYKIMPGENCMPFAQPGSAIYKRAGFIYNHLWVTPYDAAENFPAGDYVYQSQGGDGLPEWTAQNRSVENEDVVVWYVMGHHHIPRLEDWPVMPVAQMGFMLKPSGFFDQSPAMDVPPSPKGACH